MNIGFIGFGNMGQAIANGLLASGIPGESIYACAAHYDRLRIRAADMGINAVESVEELVNACELIIPAVIPQIVEQVLSPVLDALQGKMLVSIVAGYDFRRYEGFLRPNTHHISTIPNTPISVCEGILVCEDKHSLSEEEYGIFKKLFSPIALIQPVKASQFSVAGSLGGCSPAFAAMFIEALADAAVKYGLPRSAAYPMAAQVLVGTGKMLLQSGAHPGELKDKVCSPGGTTIRGVSALEEHGFRSAVIKAIDAIEG